MPRYIGRICESGPQAGGDFYELDIEYYRPFAIANRKYAIGPSVQSITKMARAAAAPGRFVDPDFHNTHLARLVDTMGKHGMLSSYPPIRPLYGNADSRRMLLGKMGLLKVPYGGIPGSKFRNPCTWTPGVQVRYGVEHLLLLPEYSYLDGAFGDRGVLLYRVSAIYYLQRETLCLQKHAMS